MKFEKRLPSRYEITVNYYFLYTKFSKKAKKALRYNEALSRSKNKSLSNLWPANCCIFRNNSTFGF